MLAFIAGLVLGLAGGALGYRWLIHKAPAALDDAKRKVQEL